MYALGLMAVHKGCNFVADTRDGFEDSPEDTQWIFDEFIPLARKTDCKFVFFIIDKDNSLKKELDAQTGELKKLFRRSRMLRPGRGQGNPEGRRKQII